MERTEQGRAVSTEFLTHFFHRWERAWSSGEPSQVAGLLTDDVMFQSSDIPETLHSRSEVLEYLEALFRAFPHQRLKVLDFYIAADGHSAADRARWSGTMTGPLDPPGFAPTGQLVEMTAYGGFRFRGDQVSWFQAVFDMLNIGQQIAAVPAAGSFADRMGRRMQHRAAKRMRKG